MNLLALGVIGTALLPWPAQSVEKEPPIQERISAIRSIRNVSDQLLLVDLKSFVSDHRPSMRMAGKFHSPKYFEPKDVEQKMKCLDLMRQAIYSTQMRLRDIDFVMERLKNNLPFQMAFLFYRLEQLTVDMRRIYTLALKNREQKHVDKHIIWYEHIARKYVDVLYIVQFVIDTHEFAMKQLEVLMGPKTPE